ncbi:hypothetical protein DEJ48_10760 [Streptomyces venezuelae]|uniref:Uncharacterized protein n=1 Tax=Streptomyces venezuelae TaxID=54571 RepID=A0A5P2BU43_STRVZ|nr:hypothetical protein [Streptomyces venezuelae]QES33803.1 hypothetical protein DEJ48_10760 [Streptomyces venezuelae]
MPVLTETEQTTETAKPPQGSHHWVMTLDLPGRLSVTAANTCTPPQGWTRLDVYTAIREELARSNPDLARANVTFFALEPNQL